MANIECTCPTCEFRKIFLTCLKGNIVDMLHLTDAQADEVITKVDEAIDMAWLSHPIVQHLAFTKGAELLQEIEEEKKKHTQQRGRALN